MSKEPGVPSYPEDLDAIRDWFRQLAGFVQARDFKAAHALTREDFLVFGTFADFVSGREAAEQAQWRNVWPNISDFRFRLDDVRGFVSPDRLFAVGLAIFDSTGYREDGTPFDRPGRATVAFERGKVGDRWVAIHTHMSLFRDVPQVSYGRRAA
ncbi:MAG TPA: nuclear transport factor 2 family protein [Bauldia sp.]|nr:nuclear transport factor 2 family protein [Bauldia sp.]